MNLVTQYTFAVSDDMLLQEDLLQMVPMISETNAMAEELGKKVTSNHSQGTCPILNVFKPLIFITCFLFYLN